MTKDEVEDLMAAFDAYIEAKAERDKCYRECACDPDYFCWRQDRELKQATTNIAVALNAVIDARVEAALRALEGE
ncbi:MAG TPA: hypothetical protein VD948_07645 [Rhodothermales bacterium]|nr:hypothetical protein [Rhodothermales bacterium]